jgi:hypothetical protein
LPVVSIRLPRSPKPVSPGSSIICTDAITATEACREARSSSSGSTAYASNWTTRSMRARLLRQRSNHVCLPNGGSTLRAALPLTSVEASTFSPPR